MALSNDEIGRYSRQLILPQVRVSGQISLKNSKIIIIGAGGLASSAALYLAAAGIGKLAVVDYDVVDISNLHRQIIHNEASLGVSKAESACSAIRKLNSNCEAVSYNILLDSTNALDIISQYDVVLDCTDNPTTRYLINDACVILKKPLVSGSAVRMDGQLTIYNYNSGPCYRCIFPTPPPPETISNCSDVGVLGVVPGIIGSFQALEAIKIVTKMEVSYSQKLLLFDAVSGAVRVIKLRGRNKDCAVCGDNPTIIELIDYVQFCGVGPHDKILSQSLLPDHDRISVEELQQIRYSKSNHFLLDVREEVQFEICSLPESTNIPLRNLQTRMSSIPKSTPIYVICRLGNDSQSAVLKLKESGFDDCKDVVGGLFEWSKKIDNDFPVY